MSVQNGLDSFTEFIGERFIHLVAQRENRVKVYMRICMMIKFVYNHWLLTSV